MVSPKFKRAHIDIIDMPEELMLKLDSIHQVKMRFYVEQSNPSIITALLYHETRSRFR